MTVLIGICFLVSLLYLATCITYVRLFLNRPVPATLPTRLLVVSLFCHAVALTARGAEAGAAGGAPFAGLSGFMSLFSFLVACVYLFMEKRYKIKPLGAFHLPVVFVIQLAASVFKSPMTEIPALKTGQLFVLHVVPAILAYAALSVSCVSGAAFLLLERQLKQKKFGLLMQHIPNLDLVETVNAAGVKIGLPLLAAGAAAGIAMGYRHFGNSYHWDVKNWVTISVVAVYALQLLLRRFGGFRGRRSVLISMFGYAAVVFGFTVVNRFFSTMHSFF